MAIKTTLGTKMITSWLTSVCLLIIAMVVVGGITRLTGSGLSITDWKPIMGAIPPLNETQWLEAFHKYQQIPQFKLINAAITLAQFKFLFFWEYIHRLLGRLMGIVYFIPGIAFWILGYFDRKLTKIFLVGLFLGALQGFLGWFMVMSGLSERTSVSHFRLAAHLSLALVVLVYLFQVLLELKNPKITPSISTPPLPRSFKRAWNAIGVILALQIIYGAFVAGLKAGYGYNTFPKMSDEWFPTLFWQLSTGYLNLLENPVAVQFIHRWLGTLFLAAITVFWGFSRKIELSHTTKKALNICTALAWAQFVLGVITLLLVVPLSLASLHQFTATLLLLAYYWTKNSLDAIL